MIDVSGWGEFRVGDLFAKLDLKRVKRTFNKAEDISLMQTKEFNLPLVNAKHSNNGIMYYGRKTDWECVAMTIDIVEDGAASTGDVYAQPQKTGVLYNAYLIKPSWNCTSEAVLLYMSCIIQKCVKSHFGYDNKCTWDKVSKEIIKLPITLTGQPDWAYMESFMKRVMEESEKSLENLRNIEREKRLIDRRTWREFNIENLFDVHPTRAYKINNNKLLDSNGKNPVVANSGYNNGIGGYTNFDCTEGAGIITFTDTAAKSSESFFYQNAPFVGYPHVQGMYMKEHKLTEKEGKFIATVLRATVGKYDFIVKMTRAEILKLVIKLPITSTGEPDWEYMETYMKASLDNSEKKIEALESVMG